MEIVSALNSANADDVKQMTMKTCLYVSINCSHTLFEHSGLDRSANEKRQMEKQRKEWIKLHHTRDFWKERLKMLSCG